MSGGPVPSRAGGARDIALWGVCSLLGRTWRYRIEGATSWEPYGCPAKGVIYCFWHSQILQFAYGFRRCGITTVISASRDGDRAASIASLWGHTAIRGSSSRKGVSVLRTSVRVLREGHSVAVVPDGPRGPREQAKPGAAQIALLSGAPLVAVRALPSHALRLRSWDRFEFPVPFARVKVWFSEPIRPGRFDGLPDPARRMTEQLQARLRGHR